MRDIRVGTAFYRPATLGERVAAELKDRISFYLVPAPPLVLGLITENLWVLALVPASVVFLIVADVALFVARGQTVGMWMTRIRMIDVETAARPSWRRLVARGAAETINPFPWLAIYRRSDRRAWYERITGTAIVRTR